MQYAYQGDVYILKLFYGTLITFCDILHSGTKLLCYETLTYETPMLSDTTLSDVYVVLCYILYQHPFVSYYYSVLFFFQWNLNSRLRMKELKTLRS